MGLVACDGAGSGSIQELVSAGPTTPGGPSVFDGTLAQHGVGQKPGFQSGSGLTGAELFVKQFKPSEGLGPFYNATACVSCHSTPTVGGGAPLYRNFYLLNYGPPESQARHPYLPSVVVPNFSAPTVWLQSEFSTTEGRTHITPSIHGFPANLEQRNSISALGTGLFELVTNATIIGLSDPDDLDGDGVSGRYNTEAGAIGRFGVKAQANNLEGFTRGPLQNQMGITTVAFEGMDAVVSLARSSYRQVAVNPNAPTIDNDGVPDPELPREQLGALIQFTRDLPAPQKTLPFSSAALAGEITFATIGCAKCHVPALPLSDGGVAEAYTDLLIHDMGNDLAGTISQGVPQPSTITGDTTEREWRTSPLWGVKFTNPYLHDGRAETLDEAIRMHDGEGLQSRLDYENLTQAQRDEVIEFLEHL